MLSTSPHTTSNRWFASTCCWIWFDLIWFDLTRHWHTSLELSLVQLFNFFFNYFVSFCLIYVVSVFLWNIPNNSRLWSRFCGFNEIGLIVIVIVSHMKLLPKCTYVDHNGRCHVCCVVYPVIDVFRWLWRIWLNIKNTCCTTRHHFPADKRFKNWWEFEIDIFWSVNHLIWKFTDGKSNDSNRINFIWTLFRVS